MENSPDRPDADTADRDASQETEIILIDKEGWEFIKNSVDERIIAIATLAERWALHMQKGLSEGKRLEEIWPETDALVDTAAIGPDMKLTAIRMLTKYWAYGEQLRQLINSQDGES